MEALRKILHADNLQLLIDLPESCQGKDLEVIVLPFEVSQGNQVENKSPKRVFDYFKGKVEISDDFDAPLANEFWLGEE